MTKKTSKKASTKKPKAAPKPPVQPPTCEVCGKPIQYGERCVAHELTHMITGYAEEREAQGSAFTGLLCRLGGQFLGNAIEQDLHKKALMMAAMHRMKRQQQQQQQQQQAPQSADPFAVLGLDRTATVESVRARQRELARIFHVDVGGGAAANERMVEINAAADEAIRILQG